MLRGNLAGAQGTGFLIAALSLFFLGAMAFAIPEAPIAVPAGDGLRGFVTGHGQVSSGLAEVIARQDYNILVLDLDTAPLGADALWLRHLHHVESRRFPVWGWLDPSARADSVPALLRSINLSGLFVVGPDAVAQARALAQARPGLRILPVVAWGATLPTEGEYAVSMDVPTFEMHAGEVALPVLRAGDLGIADIDRLRAKAKSGVIVCRAG